MVKKYLTLSCIRHGQVSYTRYHHAVAQLLMPPRYNAFQCQTNVVPVVHERGIPDPLTTAGRRQASNLGIVWKDAHIDHIYTSPLDRAIDTATALLAANENEAVKSLPLIQRWDVEEQWHGSDLTQPGLSASARQWIAGAHLRGEELRAHRPGGGGESYNDVAARAKLFTLDIFDKHGVELAEKPVCSKENKDQLSADVNELPEGVPHIVLVSHNIFLSELYEAQLCWERHQQTSIGYNNTDWYALAKVPVYLRLIIGPSGRVTFCAWRLMKKERVSPWSRGLGPVAVSPGTITRSIDTKRNVLFAIAMFQKGRRQWGVNKQCA